MSGYFADENIPLDAVKMLRMEDVDVISAIESFRGADDQIILLESIKAKRILITFDKDFGDYVYYQKTATPYGIILLRFKPKTAIDVYKIISGLLRGQFDFEGHFSIVTEKKIRMIPLEKQEVAD